MSTVTLDDRYLIEEGTVFLSGIQALVRLPMDQCRRDRRVGLRVGTFISGYQGSPLAGLDLALRRAHRLLEVYDIVHVPGVNEELAATAVMGTQMLDLFPHARFDGVTGFWYGKGPGVDRCGDVFKHANFGGTGRHSAAIILGGDDHVAKSSTLPHQSDYAYMSAGIPVLYPASVAEFLELGLHAIALSRFAGCWVALKLVTNFCDGGETVHVSPDHPRIVIPEVEIDGRSFQKFTDFSFLPPGTLEAERHLFYERHMAVRAYARANGLDRLEVASPHDRVGVVTAGKSYADTRQALLDMGLDEGTLRRLGVRLLRLGLIYPVDPEILSRFADGLEEVIVIEEKRGFIEAQVREVLYDLPNRPRIVGKTDEKGVPLFPIQGELDADLIAERLGPRLLPFIGEHPGILKRLAEIQTVRRRPSESSITRGPNYCSGCPHNTSTVALEGQVVGGGIGCHGMAILVEQPRRHVAYLTQMGGEGAPWVGLSPFTDHPHLFQNLGDGTFFHSGHLALRFAVASGVNLTFKLLYNGVVAMTGGQDVAGGRSIPDLTRLLEAEGVKRIAVVTEDPRRYRGVRLSPLAEVYPRERYEQVVRELEKVQGVTVLIYDQMCAAERRRLRKRGKLPEPNRFVVINEEVCEGCGHCGGVSNCMSLYPVETEFGRKTQVHQSSCNKDYSCLKGDCPSFVTVEVKPGTGLRKRYPPVLEGNDLPEPREKVEISGVYHIYIPGIGGTGVVTVNAILGYAALMEGKEVLTLDQTGLAQKGGAVLSSLILAEGKGALAANKVGVGKADLYLVLDILGGGNPVNLDRVSPDRTVAVVNMTPVPTGEMIRNEDLSFPNLESLKGIINRYTSSRRNTFVDAGTIVEGLFADHLLTNIFTLGVAYQKGLVPLAAESIEAALRLNGVQVEENIQAFRYGRLYAHDPTRVEGLFRSPRRGFAEERAEALARLPLKVRPAYEALLDRTRHLDEEVRRMLAIRIAELIEYQDTRYAFQYVDFVLKVADREAEVTPGRRDLTHAVIRSLYKLMAYKDEYEVARLHLKESWRERLLGMFAEPRRLIYHLHPPVLRALGLKRKLALGPWLTVVFRLLYGMRRLRGTPFDPFGYQAIRREERHLIRWYREAVETVLEALGPATHDLAVEVAKAPERIRGYEAIKAAKMIRVKGEVQALLDGLRAGLVKAPTPGGNRTGR